MGIDTEKVAEILKKRMQINRGEINVADAAADLRALGYLPEVIEQALGDAERSRTLRPWRPYLLDIFRDIASHGQAGVAHLQRLWDHTERLTDLLGDEDLQRTIAALSHTQPGCEVIRDYVVPRLMRLHSAGDLRSDWSWWLIYSSGVLAGRSVKLDRAGADALRSFASRRDDERVKDLDRILAFHA